MNKEIIVDIHPYQTRVALLEDGELAEIYIERRHKQCLVGNIYKGKVQNILPGMQAAFVDIGTEKNAFLYAGDVYVDTASFEFGEGAPQAMQDGEAPCIKDMLKPNQELMVQVVKEPSGTKSARITIHVTLPGRLLVLMPTVNYVGVSRRIEDDGERARLKELLERLKPPGMGIIVRTAAEGKSEAEFDEEIRFLTRMWERIREKTASATAPKLVHLEESLIFRTIRDIFSSDIRRMYINDHDYFEKAVALSNIVTPWLTERIEYFGADEDIFDYFGLESRVDKSLYRKVWMKNGSYLVIDQTEALTTIDVNTGKYVGENDLQETILNTNLEAAKEIARQLRVRDISGIIIIDFIDMDILENREKVVETLREHLKKDRTKTNVLGITNLGLVEMTRRKLRQRVSDVMQMTCPYCNGVGKVYSEETMALKIRKELLRQFRNTDFDSFIVEANSKVVARILRQRDDNAAFIECPDGYHLYFQPVDSMHMEKFRVKGEYGQLEIEKRYQQALRY